MTEYILYAWGFYYFVKKVDYRRFKASLINFLKGFGLILCGKMVAIFIHSLNQYDIDSYKVDMFLGTPLVIFSIIKIAKLFNKKDEEKTVN